MPIRAILFDKDGTLVDFQRTWGPATLPVLTKIAAGDRAAFERLVAVSLYLPDEQRFLPGSPVVIEPTHVYGALWAQALGRPATPDFIDEIDRLFFQSTLDHLSTIGEPKSLLAGLAGRGYRLGMMTNDAELNTRAQVRRLGLEDLLGFIAAYDSGFGAKPAPGPVLAFAAAAKVPPAEIAVVGDTVHDLAAARAAGAVAVGVLTGPTGTGALAPHADVLLPSVSALPAWLGHR
jgi:phosphoglycolate phosphatase